MERLDRSSKTYIKSMSRRDAGEEKEKQLPVGYFGSALTTHGEDFEPDSEFGQCLSALGRANERIARVQETYSANATSSWLESVERSLVQMKEYQAARKKLDSRRLAYDTASLKMQKSKKEDFRMEEELRSQKAKYEESNEEVYRRMLDIKEAEVDSVSDLTSFLEAELTYYDRCREVLMQVKRDWPAYVHSAGQSSTVHANAVADKLEPIAQALPVQSTVCSAACRAQEQARSPSVSPALRRTSLLSLQFDRALVREFRLVRTRRGAKCQVSTFPAVQLPVVLNPVSKALPPSPVAIRLQECHDCPASPRIPLQSWPDDLSCASRNATIKPAMSSATTRATTRTLQASSNTRARTASPRTQRLMAGRGHRLHLLRAGVRSRPLRRLLSAALSVRAKCRIIE